MSQSSADETVNPPRVTEFDVIDPNDLSRQTWGRRLSYSEASKLASRLGKWARVVPHEPESL
jgi:hypothetical protein